MKLFLKKNLQWQTGNVISDRILCICILFFTHLVKTYFLNKIKHEKQDFHVNGTCKPRPNNGTAKQSTWHKNQCISQTCETFDYQYISQRTASECIMYLGLADNSQRQKITEHDCRTQGEWVTFRWRFSCWLKQHSFHCHICLQINRALYQC